MKTHSFLWLLAILIVMLLGPLLVAPAKYEALHDAELSKAIEWYGKEEVIGIGRAGNAIYRHTMIDSGLDAFLRNHLMAKERDVTQFTTGVAMPEVLQKPLASSLDYWDGMINHLDLVAFRIAHGWYWAWFLHPFLIAIIFDGVMTRKAKLASFQYTSPTLYNLAWHSIIGIVALALLVITLATPISLLFYPTTIAVIGILIRVVIANIQHSA